MTREEKCLLAIERGYTYNPETGEIFNKFGKLISGLNGAKYVNIHFRFNKKRCNLLAHQFAWYLIYKECVLEIDHINGIRNDNKIYNLRSVTRNQNQWNKKTSKGFFFNKIRNKYQSQIYLNNKKIYLGLFNTEEEAKNAYLQAKEKYHII